jgi:predicted SPOUT superfamily RNA methylase MTH1
LFLGKKNADHLDAQIARAAAIFAVDEIVVFNEPPPPTQAQSNGFQRGKYRDPDEEAGYDQLMVDVLRYLEVPQCVVEAFLRQ